jgi:integrase
MDYELIFNNAKLSDASKKSYNSKMKKIMNLFDNTIPSFNTIMEDDNITINNKYAYMNAILAYKKHKQLPRDENEQQIYKDIQEELKIYSNTPTTKQVNNKVEYNKLEEVIDKLLIERKYEEALLLGMYSLVEPLRSNYGSVRITYNKEQSNFLRYQNENHLYEDKIYLYNLKTNKGKEFIIDLPEKLQQIIELSLTNNARNYLFVNSKNKSMNNEAFSIYANRLLNKIFDKKITLTDLRHSKINDLDMNELTTKEKIDIANKMNHSILMQDKYRLKYDDVNKVKDDVNKVKDEVNKNKTTKQSLFNSLYNYFSQRVIEV